MTFLRNDDKNIKTNHMKVAWLYFFLPIFNSLRKLARPHDVSCTFF